MTTVMPTLDEALASAHSWECNSIATATGVQARNVKDWQRKGTDHLAGWVRREIARVLRIAESATHESGHPFARALRRASNPQRLRIAEGLAISASELRRRARDGWTPAPHLRRQVAAVLQREPADLFPEGR